jgi:hypothetical protein
MRPVVLDLPFRGRWVTQNSPARRVPSHGTDLLGTTYAIDFVAVDENGRSAARTVRSWLTTEPPEVFLGFGAPILAPVEGTVVAVYDGEPDHGARRSPLTLVPYALGQAGRLRQGPAAIAGNHVVIAQRRRGDGPPDTGGPGPFVTLVHLRRGSVRVQVGDAVRVGDQIGSCGNSGNSTEPHVHVQATDSPDWATARGLPLAFRRPDDPTRSWLPAESEIVLVPDGARDR